MTDDETAKAAELRETIARLRPKVEEDRERAAERARQIRTGTAQLVYQGLAQALGTLLAAAVLYLIAIAAGELKATDPVTFIAVAGLIAGAAASAFSARWLVLPSKRTEMKLVGAHWDLLGIEVRGRLERGEPLTIEEARWVQMGLISLEGMDDSASSS